MNRRKQQKMLMMGIVCGLIVSMAIGYAAFNTVLDINGNANITSKWNIHFDSTRTTETPGVVVGIAGLTGAEVPTGTVTYEGDLTANLTADLIQPGDKVEYNLVVKNDGDLNAKLDKLKVSEPDNDVITFEVTGIKEGDSLIAGTTANLIVTVTYKDIEQGQGQPESTTSNLKVTLGFTQDIGNSGTVTPEPTPFTGTLYRRTTDTLNIGDSIGELERIEDSATLGKNHYLKHDVVNNKITVSYVCFVTDEEHCMQGGSPDYYETNKALIQSQEQWFTNNGGGCTDYGSSFGCRGGGFGGVNAFSNGYVFATAASVECYVYSGGNSRCG